MFLLKIIEKNFFTLIYSEFSSLHSELYSDKLFPELSSIEESIFLIYIVIKFIILFFLNFDCKIILYFPSITLLNF